MKSLCVGLILLSGISAIFAQEKEISPATNIEVHVDKDDGAMSPVWTYFGYDEPNYTYAPNGKKLLGELAALSPTPVYIRVHNILTSGDGSSSLKWGSTNAYTEDASGKPVYSWTIVDQIFDTFHEVGVKPLVEIGFMPEAMSTHPTPYRHDFPHGSIFTGWAYPPKDYSKWGELVFQFVRHLRERYGDAELSTWMWEVWNEPDIDYWKGTPEEFFKLYDFSVEATLRAFPKARIGGPDSTGPATPKAADFLHQFLEHCASGKNYATGKMGAELDFISFHPKGSTKWMGDHVQMGIARQLAAVEQGFQIVKSFPQWQHTPILLGESDPEGCAACSAQENPQNSYRNGPLYAAYTAESINNIQQLAHHDDVNFLGAVTWAFEFEAQHPFEGFRELATDGIDKPVLNVFRMFGLMGKERVKVTSSSGLAADQVESSGVRGQPDINAVATRSDHAVEVLVWNYHDDDVPVPPASINLSVMGLPADVSRTRVEHFRIDSSHSNAFTVWKAMGFPQYLTDQQRKTLQAAGALQVPAPYWVSTKASSVALRFSLEREAVSLLRISW